MKAYVRWTRESEGVTAIEVDEDEVLAWVNEGLTEPFAEVTGEMVADFLEAGDGDWVDLVDFERDYKFLPWSEFSVDTVTLQDAT